MTEFRFQELQIWQRAVEVAIQLDEIALALEESRRFRYAEQLRAAGLSISNNIAEGSGSNSNVDFRKYLYIARKSAFECANMILIFNRQKYHSDEKATKLLQELEAICKMIVAFARKLDS